MKRTILLFFLITLLLTLGVCASDMVTCSLDETGISLDVPADCTVLTRNMDPDDPALALFGMTPDEITQFLEEQNLYLQLTNDDPNFLYVVSMTENNVNSFNLLSSEYMELLSQSIVEQLKAVNLSVQEIDTYSNDRMTFVWLIAETETDGVKQMLERYYTISNHLAVNLSLQYTGTEIPEEYSALAKEIADSLCFDSKTRTYRIDDLDMSIDVPMNYAMYTRDPEDPVMNQYVVDPGQIIQNMEAEQIYLMLMNNDPNVYLRFVAIPYYLKNLEVCGDSVRDIFQKQVAEDLKNNGFTVDQSEPYSEGPIRFYRYTGTTQRDGTDVQYLSYFSAYHFYGLNLTVEYKGSEMPEEYAQLAKDMVDAIRFDPGADDADQPDFRAEAIDFTDGVSGVRFTVPEGWVEMEVDPSKLVGINQDDVRGIFGWVKDLETTTIGLSVFDLMEKMPALAQRFVSRAWVGQNAFGIDELAEAMSGQNFIFLPNYSIKKYHSETIGGREFYFYEWERPLSILDVDLSNGGFDPFGDSEEAARLRETSHYTEAIRIENGYLYDFEFLGTPENPCYQDFLTLLESAEFPAFEAAETEKAGADGTRRFPVLLVVFIGLAVVLAVLGGVFLGRRLRKRKPVDTAPIAPAPPAVPARRICAACGAGLDDGETVCPYCGTTAE